MITTPSSAYWPLYFPFVAVCGLHKGVCPISPLSSAPAIVCCARCGRTAPTKNSAPAEKA